MTSLYRAPMQDTVLLHDLGEMHAAYHRPSGQTHLLVDPAPQLLALLTDSPQSANTLVARLSEDFALDAVDDDLAAAVTARLDELVSVGLAQLDGDADNAA